MQQTAINSPVRTCTGQHLNLARTSGITLCNPACTKNEYLRLMRAFAAQGTLYQLFLVYCYNFLQTLPQKID